jgi:hypothetical protein
VGRLTASQGVGAPSRWLVVFDKAASNGFTSLIAMGKYKHCRVFGWVDKVNCYVFVDCQFGGMTVQVASGEAAKALMLEWTENADVLSLVPKCPGMSRNVPFVPLLCTTVVAKLLGLSGRAWRPDALYVECLRAGGVPIHGRTQGTAAGTRSDAAAADEDGPAAADPGAAVRSAG